MPIDADFAEEYIADRSAWAAEPALDIEQREAILEAALTTDANGLSPGADDYEETYTYDSLHLAIVQAWEIKVAAAAELNEGDEKIIYDHCKERLNYWLGRVNPTDLNGPVGVNPTSEKVAHDWSW